MLQNALLMFHETWYCQISLIGLVNIWHCVIWYHLDVLPMLPILCLNVASMQIQARSIFFKIWLPNNTFDDDKRNLRSTPSKLPLTPFFTIRFFEIDALNSFMNKNCYLTTKKRSLEQRWHLWLPHLKYYYYAYHLKFEPSYIFQTYWYRQTPTVKCDLRLMFWSNVMSCELLWKIGDHSLIRSLNNVYVHNFTKNRKTKQVKRVSSAKFRSFGSRRMYSFIFGCEVLLLYVVVMSYHLHCVPKENYNVLFYGCWLLFLFAHYPFPYQL